MLAGCGGAHRATSTTPIPPGPTGPPSGAHVEPYAGGPATVFRVLIPLTHRLGVWAHTIHGYEVRLRNATAGTGCIVDPDGYLHAGRAGSEGKLVLDPAHMMGVRWCPGSFQGELRYYEAFACPAGGTCHIPSRFHQRSLPVARIAFTVTDH